MGVFISYRRSDSDVALLLYSWLRERFGAGQVFWDREDIPPGARWADRLQALLQQSRALVALIGPDWVTMADTEGRRRLDDPGDWVRREVAEALTLDLLVVPGLLSRTETPSADELPGDLADLSRRQAVRLSDLRVRDQLVAALDTVLEPAAPPAPERSPQAQRMQRLLSRQVHRLQTRAVELLQEGRAGRAADELREGAELLILLLELSPGDVGLDAQLGYLYGTMAQNFDAVGDREQADRYAALASAVFERILETAMVEDTAAVASAINGLAGVLRGRGQLDEAINLHRHAVGLLPSYAYAGTTCSRRWTCAPATTASTSTP